MSQSSLPLMLQMALKQHVLASDIQDDEELQNIMHKLVELNSKLEVIKDKARAKKLAR
ncbi:hypothetical protein [Glaciecola sp. 1036]|uniref:hypothetical protein n=1 Tax=Alteromonadaceae TaxID=72275 RepID=UPI003D0430B2